MSQISIFDGSRQFKLNKPIRLIELFAGYGSQSLALQYLGVDFESWKICEWAVKSIQAYKDIHFDKDNTDYSDGHSKEYILNRLLRWGISSNYNEPMTKQQIMRLGEEKQRTIFNNIKATHNLVNIQQVNGSDLEIVDTDKYCYVMTYSFPCQDLSRAGKCKGMAKDSGTRSGMLWEVERILDECLVANSLPQVLLMENVPDVIGTKNIGHFSNWIAKLEWLGYKNKWQVLNAKDYGIPQNRERCFMVSILGDYYYDFPKEIKNQADLLELLDDIVDEKYYLSDKAITGKLDTNFCTNKLENIIPKAGIVPTLLARDYKDPKCIIEIVDNKSRSTLKKELCKRLVNSGLLNIGTVINHSYTNGLNGKNPQSRQNLEDYIERQDGICCCLTTRPDTLGVTVFDDDKLSLRIRKLTPKECFRLMGVKDKDFAKVERSQSNSSLYHLAGDSIVVDVLMAIFKKML